MLFLIISSNRTDKQTYTPSPYFHIFLVFLLSYFPLGLFRLYLHIDPSAQTLHIKPSSQH
jgi:hypothetical protein